MTIPYKKASERRKQILETACQLAENSHYSKIRRHHLAEKCNTASGNISRVIGSMSDMRQAVIEYALDNGYDGVVAQAIVNKHPAVSHLATDERAKYLAAIA